MRRGWRVSSAELRGLLSKMCREWVSSNLGRTIANGRYRLDLAAPNRYALIAAQI
jgi:hypothetical protein